MYEHVDWMKCKGCGRSNTLFKLRIDGYHRRKTGNIRYKTTQWCRECYRENQRGKNDKYFADPIKREKAYQHQREHRCGNPKYQEMARRYYQKRRESALEQKRRKYVSQRTSKPDILNRVKIRQSIIHNVYVR